MKTIAGVALAATVGLASVPSAAHAGFLEQLFGLAPTPAPVPQAPSYDFGQPAPTYRLAPAKPKRRVVVDEKPKLQKPTDLMHDGTLQTGDAVMTKDGLRIYTGDDGATRHAKSDFDPIDALDGVPKAERQALAAIDTSSNDPLRGGMRPDTIASGRSASVSVPVAQGRPIIDARGKTVRYVGP